MPFTFEPLNVTSRGHETVLRGRVVAGAYFGPEAAVVRSTQGQELATHIHSHLLEYPAGWPVLPEHEKTTLVLSIPALPPGFELASLTGVGTVLEAEARVDVSQLLEEPRFWASQLAQHCVGDDAEDPSAAWLGIEAKAASDWYRTTLDVHVKANVWPYLRVPLARARYIELEMAGGVEYQDRIWIGDESGGRVLLGYHSGHFSLPALAAPEVAQLAAETDFAASGLLWLAATYAAEAQELLPLAERLASAIPGLIDGSHGALARALSQRLTVPSVEWRVDPILGLINNWPYSQRNPQSQLSLLKPDDFSFIRRFFAT